MDLRAAPSQVLFHAVGGFDVGVEGHREHAPGVGGGGAADAGDAPDFPLQLERAGLAGVSFETERPFPHVRLDPLNVVADQVAHLVVAEQRGVELDVHAGVVGVGGNPQDAALPGQPLIVCLHESCRMEPPID